MPAMSAANWNSEQWGSFQWGDSSGVLTSHSTNSATASSSKIVTAIIGLPPYSEGANP